MDKATGKPKGTAFIEFRAPAGAAAAAEACARARAGKGPDVTVKGVKLNVDLALTQDDARRLGQEQGGVPGAGQSAGQSNKGGKFDRRNLYLAKEGFIEEGSAQWEAMSENDRWALLCVIFDFEQLNNCSVDCWRRVWRMVGWVGGFEAGCLQQCYHVAGHCWWSNVWSVPLQPSEPPSFVLLHLLLYTRQLLLTLLTICAVVQAQAQACSRGEEPEAQVAKLCGECASSSACKGPTAVCVTAYSDCL
jgi:hypothetical protein